MSTGQFLLMFGVASIGGILGSMAENRWHFIQQIVNKLINRKGA